MSLNASSSMRTETAISLAPCCPGQRAPEGWRPARARWFRPTTGRGRRGTCCRWSAQPRAREPRRRRWPSAPDAARAASACGSSTVLLDEARTGGPELHRHALFELAQLLFGRELLAADELVAERREQLGADADAGRLGRHVQDGLQPLKAQSLPVLPGECFAQVAGLDVEPVSQLLWRDDRDGVADHIEEPRPLFGRARITNGPEVQLHGTPCVNSRDAVSRRFTRTGAHS